MAFTSKRLLLQTQLFQRKELRIVSFYYTKKMMPTGLWYQVSPRHYPFDFTLRERILNPLGIKSYSWFTKDKFEGTPFFKPSKLKILYYTRLWEPILDNDILNQERIEINEMRINLIRELKSHFRGSFYGGLFSNLYSKRLASDLVLPKFSTVKNNYLKLMHSCDICIGSMGLHQSIGGKTGEYVAAAKAIVNETLHYEVTGNFSDGIHYFSFRSIDECLNAVDTLLRSPERVYEMKIANSKYYSEYLIPSVLVRRTLDSINIY